MFVSGSEEESSSEEENDNAEKKVCYGYRYRYMIVKLPLHDRRYQLYLGREPGRCPH